ncbi:MAG: hypothetical protein EXQ64_03455 [Ilumatobacteraceae bacterium]|nr:hypothetical protein [Ilumatobacteraceae bacterium]
MRKFVHLIAILGLLIVATSCASGSSTTVSSTTVSLPTNTQGAVQQQQMTTIDGRQFDLAKEIKDKPVAFWFWAPG